MILAINIDFSEAIFTDSRKDNWEFDVVGLPNTLILKHAKGLRNVSDHERLHVPFKNIGMFSIRGLAIGKRKEK